MEYAVIVENLRKTFGKVVAVDDLSFYVKPGEIFGLIGPNGAGKTTTLRILSTLLLPTSGKVKIYGHDVVEEPETIRRIISYLPEEGGAYEQLTGREYLEFMANFIENDKEKIKEMVNEAAEISGLGSRLADKIRTYSKGMKRRLLVARSLMIKPKLAILDEPTSGLDVIHAVHVRNVIKKYAKEHEVTIILSSHNMLEIEHICDRVVIMNLGRKVIEGNPQELKEKFAAENLEELFVMAVRRHA